MAGTRLGTLLAAVAGAATCAAGLTLLPGPLVTALGERGVAVVSGGGTDAAPDQLRPNQQLNGAGVGFSPGFELLDAPAERRRDDLARIHALGAERVRVDISWARIEPRAGHYTWTTTDRVVQAAREAGLTVLGVLCYEPRWARTHDDAGALQPVDPDRFARFAEAAARRYADTVEDWEIWNEPNTERFWPSGPDPAAYARVVEAVAPRLRTADPGATVVAGALAPAEAAADGSEIPPQDFLAGVYDHTTGTSAFDAVSVHPYSYPARPTGGQPWNLFGHLDDLRDLMVGAGDADARLWITEYGAPTGRSDRAVSPRRQADLLVAAYRAWRRLDFAGPLFFYSFRDAGRRLGHPEDNFGVVRYDGRPKPAYAAVSRLLRAIDPRRGDSRGSR